MQNNQKVVLITGAAKRVGATVARKLHDQGMRIAIHYRHSADEAQTLSRQLNDKRPNSSITLQADLSDVRSLTQLVENVIQTWGQLDVLINNASNFYPTPIGEATQQHWDDLFASNAKAPFFLSQAAAPYLKKQQGCIVNMIDIQARQPLKSHTVYCMAKSALLMMTKSLAKELGPEVRVNAIAPGVVLWAAHENDEMLQNKILARTALKRAGTPEDIATTMLFLVEQANYITGQMIAVDGGRMLDF